MDHYDIVILGTGLSECVLSAVLSHSGYSVLHVDSSDRYGTSFQNYNYADLCTRYGKPCLPILAPLTNKFSIDYTPKLLLAGGLTQRVLIKYDLSSLVNFLLIPGCYVYKHRLYEVPTSETKSLQTGLISFLQKPRLVRFFYNVRKYFRRVPIRLMATMREQYRHYGIDEHSAQVIGHAVALNLDDEYLDERPECTFEKIRLYIESLRENGDEISPFVYPLYGMSEVCQAFVRKASVAGAVYRLRTSVVEIKSNGEFSAYGDGEGGDGGSKGEGDDGSCKGACIGEECGKKGRGEGEGECRRDECGDESSKKGCGDESSKKGRGDGGSKDKKDRKDENNNTENDERNNNEIIENENKTDEKYKIEDKQEGECKEKERIDGSAKQNVKNAEDKDDEPLHSKNAEKNKKGPHYNFTVKIRPADEEPLEIRCKALISEISYTPNKQPTNKKVIRATLIIDGVVPLLKHVPSAQILFLSSGLHRKTDVFALVLGHRECVAPKGYKVVLISYVKEGENDRTLDRIVHLFGKVVDRFVREEEMMVNERVDRGWYVVGGCDESMHVENGMQEVVKVLEKMKRDGFKIECSF
ncbi:RAB proteins geranylgeranyltransferase component A (RAB escort protein) [Trachipleistophora hominis]|uniref:Rab GDP dissociation inhibitor n=1 Tax=Trachipleistophora hominis TaxID=72359 RepID=L7JRD5_TRAHO|nr:RAB proteins geranylgeranyltransferase component A (RAB escort protein) [Trachipleistophora hominis]